MTFPDTGQSQTKLDIKKLKEWAKKTLPSSSTLREGLLHEDDELAVDVYLAKCSTWMALARLENQSSKYGWEQLGEG